MTSLAFHDKGACAGALDVGSERSHRINSRETVLALQESGDRAPPLSKRGEHGASMRHALVSRNSDGGADRAAVMDSKSMHENF